MNMWLAVVLIVSAFLAGGAIGAIYMAYQVTKDLWD